MPWLRRCGLAAGMFLASAAACANLDGLAGGIEPQKPDASTPAEAAAPTEAAAADIADATPLDAGVPTPVDLAVNDVASCATVEYGADARATYCWGAAADGGTPAYLGVTAVPANGFAQPQDSIEGAPLPITALYGAGSWFLAAARPAGRTEPIAYTWGASDQNQTGNGVVPTVLPTALSASGPIPIATAGVGPTHGCLVTPAGTPFCWGDNTMCEITGPSNGGLGSAPLGNNCSSPAPVTRVQTINPSLVFQNVAAGGHHTCATGNNLAEGGLEFECWGDDSRLQVGRSPATSEATGTGSFPGDFALLGMPTIAAGASHTCALGTHLMCWGDNTHGQTLPGSDASAAAPTELAFSAFGRVSGMALAGDESCLIVQRLEDEKAVVYCYGAEQPNPEDGGLATAGVALPGIDTPTKIAISTRHGCAIAHGTDDPTLRVYCWGANDQHQVDPTAPSDIAFPTPHAVPIPIPQ